MRSTSLYYLLIQNVNLKFLFFSLFQKLPGEELTFENMKRILTENNNNQIIEEEKRVQISQLFQSAPFEDLVNKTQPKVINFHFLYQILSRILLTINYILF